MEHRQVTNVTVVSVEFSLDDGRGKCDANIPFRKFFRDLDEELA